MILSLENNTPDNLKILDLVKVYTNDKTGPLSASQMNSNENANNKTNIVEEKADPVNTNKLLNEPMAGSNILNTGNLNSPINLITNAGCATTVLAVSGISTNVLIGSGALGMSQIANFNTIANINNNMINGKVTGGMPMAAFIKQDPLQNNALNGDQANVNSLGLNGVINRQIKTLDFCYLDENKFTINDAVNLCVATVAYASNANRASQMLVILDVLIPRYLNHVKSETDKIQVNNKSPRFKTKKANTAPVNETTQQARVELGIIQKIAISIKNLVHASDFLMRTYKFDKNERNEKSEIIKVTKASNNFDPNASLLRSSTNRSPSILPDEDSK